MLFRIRDITATKLLERQHHKQQSDIALASRLSAIGEIATALEHEINQPLAAITAYSYSCLQLLNRPENNQHDIDLQLQKIVFQAKHAGDILMNMKKFVHEGDIQTEETAIHLVIKEAITSLKYEDFKFKTILNFAENLPKTKINKVHMMQVILNIIRNSIEAWKSVAQTNPLLTVETVSSQNHIKIYIRDNGPGIPEKLHDKILHTYFSTKRQGTGIGLGICRSLIDAHGGTFHFIPENKGACFMIMLPII